MVEVEENISKSPQDLRNYRYLRLPNGLKSLLVSDDTTEKASAAMSVRIGSLSDPENLPGLAHFCEHMLFLGTEKYPSENEYTEYVSHNGGIFNACTSGEFTTFFFDVACSHLRGALDRFAQFFICPLFNADSKDREVNAVESENEKNMQVDVWRFNQVCRETSRENHPYRKFASGNKYTLETKPQELGIDVREELLKFHSNYYSSNVMSLVVLGRESLNELEGMILELFSPVQNKDVPVPSFPEPPYSENELQMFLEYVPVKDVRQLRLEFPLPDLTEYYDCDPSAYVAHLIGHEGLGSLLSHLKARGWCNFLEAGPMSGAKGFMFFCVNVDLTEDGEVHVEDIVTAVFQYLAMLRVEGPKEWIFQECSNLDEIDFRFREKEKPITYTRHLTHALHEYPPRDVLAAGLLRKYRPDLVNMVLDKLKPQFIRVGVISQKFQDKTSLVEPWYGSAYNARKINPELIELWSSVHPIPELHLPEPNEFIPTDFTITPRPVGEEMQKRPVLIMDTPLTKVWFKQDDTFFSPKATLCFKMSSPLVYEDPTCHSETLLFVQLLNDSLKEFAYNAEMAGIQYKISNDVYSMLIRISGFNHKQSLLLSKIIHKMAQFHVDPKRFNIFKEILSRQLRNFRAEQPHTHAIYYASLLLDSRAWTRDEIADALETITCEKLQDFVTKFFSHVHIEALLHGNLSKQDCLDLVGIVEETLKSCASAQPLSSPMELHQQISMPNKSAFTFSITNEVHSSYCIEFYLQVGLENTRTNMLLELTSQILHEPCFNTLRTQEQLGYIVVSGLKVANGVQGYRVLVQSTKLSTFVEKRVEAFLVKAQEILSEITDESFEGHKKALAVKRSEKPKKLGEETVKYWLEIRTYQYHFDRDEVEVACLMELKKEDVMNFFMEYIAPGAALRHKLTVHVIPDAQNQSEIETNTGTNECDGALEETDSVPLESARITDISQFKSRFPLYPTVKPYTKTTL